MTKQLAKILEVLFTNKAGICMVAGLVFILLGIFDVSDFKSLRVTVRSPTAWLPFAVGIGCFVVGVFLYIVFERRAEGFAKEVTAFYEELTKDLSPPDLTFLAIASSFTFAATHGERVARLNSAWVHDQSHWYGRSMFMERRGLLQHNSSDEFVRTPLGTVIVRLALKDGRFRDLATVVRFDAELAREWRLKAANG